MRGVGFAVERVAVIGMVAAVISACSPPAPPAAGDQGAAAEQAAPAYRIAFNVAPDEGIDYEVWLMELDGSGARNLTNHPSLDWVYAAREGRLYFVSDRDDEPRAYHLYEMGADGGGLRRITGFRVTDSFVDARAGGDELVVSSAKDGTRDLYLIDRDGNELRRLTNDEAKDRDPAFSPDGTQIVWSSERSGTDELWIMDLEQGTTRQLTSYPADGAPRDEHVYRAGPPAWEPNRNVISFCSNRNGNDPIFTIRPDGTGLEQLTDDGGDDCYHDWSPDPHPPLRTIPRLRHPVVRVGTGSERVGTGSERSEVPVPSPSAGTGTSPRSKSQANTLVRRRVLDQLDPLPGLVVDLEHQAHPRGVVLELEHVRIDGRPLSRP